MYIFFSPGQKLIKKRHLMHGFIIKQTPHVGFLTLAGMPRVVERNHGLDSQRKGRNYAAFIEVWRDWIIVVTNQ